MMVGLGIGNVWKKFFWWFLGRGASGMFGCCGDLPFVRFVYVGYEEFRGEFFCGCMVSKICLWETILLWA